MENNHPNINLKIISKVTGLLCRAGARIRQKEIIKKERITIIKKKIEMLESKYKMLKEKNKHNLKLDDLNMHLSLIKNRLERISV